jgi:hypothetical protein
MRRTLLNMELSKSGIFLTDLLVYVGTFIQII